MTEEEAFTKLCVRDHGINCRGSECMAWHKTKAPRRTMRLRKGQTEKDGTPIIRAGQLVIVDGKSWRYEYTDNDENGEFDLLHMAAPENDRTHGYCGLAGKPEA